MAITQHSRRVLLLGGSGFVGRRLAAALRARGIVVRVPTRNRPRSRALLVLPDVELVTADVHDEAVLRDLLRGCDAAINLVGILNEDGSNGAGFEHAHTELAAKLVRACRAAGVRRLLHTSSLKADATRGPSHYLRSKGRAEQLIAAESAGAVDYTIFRPSVIFGPDDSLCNRFAALLRVLPFLPLARANARFAPVFVDDIVAAFVTALDDARAYGATYELCGPDIYSLGELVRFVRAAIGSHRPIVELPDALGRIQASIADYLPGKPFSRDNFASLGVDSVCSSNGFAALGIEPRSLAAIGPTYLGAGRQERLSRLRQHARRR